MGVLSDLVVASVVEARSVVDSTAPSQKWPGCDCKGLDTIKLASLWLLLEGESLGVENVVDRSERISLAAEKSPEGPWVFVLPDELRDELSALSDFGDEKVSNVTAGWAATEELDGWEFSDVSELLEDLMYYADTAKSAGKQLLLWMCL